LGGQRFQRQAVDATLPEQMRAIQCVITFLPIDFSEIRADRFGRKQIVTVVTKDRLGGRLG
jgi:hypothetical protein